MDDCIRDLVDFYFLLVKTTTTNIYMCRNATVFYCDTMCCGGVTANKCESRRNIVHVYVCLLVRVRVCVRACVRVFVCLII